MKKTLIPFILIILISINLKAQFSFNFNPADSSWTNFGGWTGVSLYVQKDSTANPDSYYWKFDCPIIQWRKYKYNHNDGVPQSIFWLDSLGYSKRSPIDSIPLKLSQITKGLGYTPMSNTVVIPSFVAGSGISITSGTITNTLPNITQTLSISSNTISISNGNSITIPTQYTPTTYTASRSINSSTFTVSSTKDVVVNYNIKITCTASIGSASDGKVLLQYSTNGGSTWIDVNEVENSNTVTLAVALNSVTIQTSTIVGNIPANAICRLVPTTSGTVTITYIRGFETY